MFKYTFTKLVDTDPECWVSLDVWCEANETADGDLVYTLHIGTLYTNRKQEDGSWETWEDDDNAFYSERPEDILAAIGFLNLANHSVILAVLGLLVHSTKQLHC